MPSAIDPTRPQDGVSASKADLRATLQTIRTEVEHGGFLRHQAPGALESTTAATLGGMWANVKTQFGAVGDGTTDDRPALQTAIDSGWPLYFPPGSYLINAPLEYWGQPIMMRGPHPHNWGGMHGASIGGNFAAPLIHPQGFYIDHNNQDIGEFEFRNTRFLFQDIGFHNAHVNGCCVQVVGNITPPSHFLRCQFTGFRGLMLNTYGSTVQHCMFHGLSGNWIRDIIAADQAHEAFGLQTAGHTTIIQCNMTGCGTGLQCTGIEVNVLGSRIEVCGYGIIVGGTAYTWGGHAGSGVSYSVYKSSITGVQMESCNRALYLANGGPGLRISDMGAQAEGGAMTPDGISDYGLLIAKAFPETEISNVLIGGPYRRAAIINTARARLSGISCANSESNRPAIGGTSVPFSQESNAVYYRVVHCPLNPSVNAAAPRTPVVTAFSDLALGGIKGLNIRDPNVLPKNLGGLESVTEGATTKAVAFPGAKVPNDAAFDGNLSASAGGSLAAGTYFYAVTLIGARGETGVSLASTGGGFYQQITISANQQVSMSFFGVSGAENFKRRIYRGPAFGQIEGFWEIPASQSSFTDDGTQAFTGRDMPPAANTISIPSLEEADASYAVVVTPSWGTTAWITGKATTGFTINFGTAAPAGATVQWLLFRP